MNPEKGVLVLLLTTGAMVQLSAQVVGPGEISRERPEQLQQRYRKALEDITIDIRAHNFPYPFYLSRVLDVDRPRARLSDQDSIRFDTYKGQVVLVTTGNYYAAYATDHMDSYERLKESFERVIAPVLQLEVSHFPGEGDFSAFAIEISHHIEQQSEGLISERPENIAMIIPVGAARKLVQAKTNEEKQEAVLDSQVFLNGQPDGLWVGEGHPSDEWKRNRLEARRRDRGETLGATERPRAANDGHVAASSDSDKAAPMSSLAALEREYQSTIARTVEALALQAHVSPDLPPAFLRFRESVYLQLSFRIGLEAGHGSSRYKLAALAFDEQISHFIAPLVGYFPANVSFEGISFHITIGLHGEPTSEVVEFFFPFSTLRCFSSYDCNGQQLLDSGVILIDGVRSALDLQVAEGMN